jgi:hypothetical protein
LYDLNGRLIQEIAAGKTTDRQALSIELDAARFVKGVYLVKLVTDHGVRVKRVLIGR